MRENNLSIPDISRATGLPDSTLRSMISRKTKNISLDVAFKLSDGLGISMEKLNGKIPITSEITTKTPLCDIIRKRRKELNLTYEQLGNMVGVGKSTVRKWEIGMIENMRRDNIISLAKVLNISPEVIIRQEYAEKNESLNNNNLSKEEMTKYITTNKNMKMNEKIKNRREDLGLTLQDIGDFIGVSKATVQRYESGEIKNLKLESIEKLATILNVSPVYLTGWEESVTDNDKEDTKKTTLLSNFNKLNDIGKDKVITYTKDLLDNNKYSIEKDHLMPIAAHDKEGKFSKEDMEHDLNLMKDDELWK
ncbi:helix-turn-helix transcriptional regulator [Clostridium tetani]|uniref:helix-turn-helix transcriptional regulator n=1 Tax=Clostridium tetani TaxID=1513 RepID=UPI0013E95C5F|nr:helix-turn-helix transcriptional regulator [Clostridium tetani]